METLFERRISSVSLDDTVSTEDLLSAFDVGHLGTEALLFQTGYLTITGEERLGEEALYRLGYPNREVRQSLNRVLRRHLVQDIRRQTDNSIRLARLLAAHDCAGMEELFHAFFASIPYEWHTNNDIANYEGYYASVFYSYFAALGYEIVVEESSSHGRLDMAVRTGGHVYLSEFKVVEMTPPGSALAQLRERGYADTYRGRGEPIHLIGVEFSRETRNVQRDRFRGSRRLTAHERGYRCSLGFRQEHFLNFDGEVAAEVLVVGEDVEVEPLPGEAFDQR